MVRIARTGRIMEILFGKAFDAIKKILGHFQVRVAGIELVDMHAAGFGFLHERQELADRRRDYGLATVGDREFIHICLPLYCIIKNLIYLNYVLKLKIPGKNPQ